MTVTEPSLDELRQEIDQIDESLHALLMRRAEVQRRIGRAKDGNAAYIRPGREARVLRRLVARHQGPFPKPVLVRIWREIFAAGVSLQAPFSVAVLADGRGEGGLARIARDHFGTLTRLQDFSTPGQVLQAVGEGRVSVGVLPLPEPEEARPWWPTMARHGEGLPRIVARLPFAQVDTHHHRVEALAVMLGTPEETEDDRGYFAVETPLDTSRSALRRALAEPGFDVTDLKAHVVPGSAAYYLVECRGIVRPGDPRLDAMIDSASGGVEQAWPLGGYAMPLGPDALV